MLGLPERKSMPFTAKQTASLLAQKGIGNTVLQRLEQMGLNDVAALAAADVDDMLQQGAALSGSTCWKLSVPCFRQPKMIRFSSHCLSGRLRWIDFLQSAFQAA